MAYYIPENLLDEIFAYISDRYARIEEVPRYRDELGFEKFCSVLEQSRSNAYYPSLLEKAVYLLVNINKGHFFSNGNKRLALVVTTIFLLSNGLRLKVESKSWYKETLEELFPEYEHWEDFTDFTSTDFATYNLSIMIADSGVYGISHDELKRRVYVFLERSTEEYNSNEA